MNKHLKCKRLFAQIERFFGYYAPIKTRRKNVLKISSWRLDNLKESDKAAVA